MLAGMDFLIADSPETNTADEIFKEFFSARRRENAFNARHGGCCRKSCIGYWFMKHACGANELAVKLSRAR
jgi:hypothetical protein